MDGQMTLDELRQELAELEKRFWKDAALLQNRFALENNKIPIGGIATDHIGSIKVESIEVQSTRDFKSGVPQLVYHGIELKKDLTPTKKGGRRHLYQCNLNKQMVP